jgi:hypothetical protein
MNKVVKLNEELEQTKSVSRKSRDPNLKGRKYKGSPYLKLKKVKTSARIRIRQLLRGFVPLEELRSAAQPEKVSQ